MFDNYLISGQSPENTNGWQTSLYLKFYFTHLILIHGHTLFIRRKLLCSFHRENIILR